MNAAIHVDVLLDGVGRCLVGLVALGLLGPGISRAAVEDDEIWVSPGTVTVHLAGSVLGVVQGTSGAPDDTATGVGRLDRLQ